MARTGLGQPAGLRPLVLALVLGSSLGPPVSAAGTLEEARRLVAARTDFEAARATLQGLLYGREDQVEVNLLLATILYEHDSLEEALTFAEKAVELAGVDPRGRLVLGQIYAAQVEKASMFKKPGLLSKAREQFEWVVAKEPRHVAARRALIGLYAEVPAIIGGSMATAREHAAAALTADQALGQVILAELNGIDGNEAEMVAACEKARVAAAGRSEVLTGAGLVLRRFKLEEKAWAYFEEALQRDPQNAMAAYQLARRAIEQGIAVDQAEGWLRLNLARWPRHDDIPWGYSHWRLAQLFEKQGKKEAALAELRLAVKALPDLAGAKSDLARLSR